MAFLDENGVSRLWTRVLSKLGSKVDKVDGKGLSTNDYTTEEKNKLAGVENGAQVNQNAIGTITAGGNTVFTSSTASDTFKLGAGSNISYTLLEDGTLDIGVTEKPDFARVDIEGTGSSKMEVRFYNTAISYNMSYVRGYPDNAVVKLGNSIYSDGGAYIGETSLEINSSDLTNLNNALQLVLKQDYENTSTYQVYHSGMTNAIPITQGGTGSSTASGALASLGAAAANHTHALSDGTITGSLPIENGGTGATTATQALLNLGGVSSYEPEFTSRITLTADSMPTIFMKATGGNTKQILIEGNTNNGLTFGISSDDTHTNRRYLGIYDPVIAPSLADALQLTSVDNGVYKSYNVFHSGAGGTFGGIAKANAASVAALETAQLRNITISTIDLVEGESTLAEGEIYLVYDGGVA